MSGSDRTPPAAFVAELAAAFRRLRPQGDPRWNFSDAFGRLEKLLADLAAPDLDDDPSTARQSADDGAPRPISRRLRQAAQRYPVSWAEGWIDGRAISAAEAATRRALIDGGVGEAVSATTEAFRFLAARVERIEEAMGRRAGPVDGLAWLVEPPVVEEWVSTTVDWLTAGLVADGDADPDGEGGAGSESADVDEPAVGPIVVGECGDGTLPLALLQRGLAVRGAEPRGALAWEAAAAGVPVHVGSVGELLGSVGSGSLGGVVLVGVVDRVPLDEQLALLELAGDRLAPDGRLLVIGTRPEAAAEGWEAVARDLLPGRPLHPETWDLLLRRSGYTEVGQLSGSGSTYAVRGRR